MRSALAKTVKRTTLRTAPLDSVSTVLIARLLVLNATCCFRLYRQELNVVTATVRNKVPIRPPLLDDGRTDSMPFERQGLSAIACMHAEIVVIIVLHRTTGGVNVN